MTNVQKNPTASSQVTAEEKQQIVQNANALIQAKDVSQEQMAVHAGIGKTSLSFMLTGKWDSVGAGKWIKLNAFLNQYQQENFIETADQAEAKQVGEKARFKRYMVGVTAGTGAGKTTWMLQTASEPNTFYVVMDSTMSLKQFFVQMLRSMGISYESNVHNMINRIAEELNTRKFPLLLIDEAGKLTDKIMLCLHVLRDKTARNCGIVLAGMPYFYTNLDKGRQKQKQGYAEFFRRIELWHSFSGLSRSEMDFICNEYGITDKKVIDSWSAKKSFGDLRNAILFYNEQNATDDEAAYN